MAGNVGSVALQAGIARGTSAILACAEPWLEAARVAVDWVLATASRASL